MTRRERRRENEELRAALGLGGQRTIEEWEALPQAVRDPLAARAWIAEWGDPGRALVRLGFPAMNRLPPEKVPAYKDHIARVFETPGVQAILKRDLSRLDADREAILARQLPRTALYGEDAESVKNSSVACQGVRMGISRRSHASDHLHVGSMSQPCLNRTPTQYTPEDVGDENDEGFFPFTHECFCLLISGSLVRVQHPEPLEKPRHCWGFSFPGFEPR